MTANYPDEWANGYHVMLDSDELVMARWDQVETLRRKNQLTKLFANGSTSNNRKKHTGNPNTTSTCGQPMPSTEPIREKYR